MQASRNDKYDYTEYILQLRCNFVRESHASHTRSFNRCTPLIEHHRAKPPLLDLIEMLA